MAETATRLPVRTEEKNTDRPAGLAEWRPLETLRRGVDQFFDDFSLRSWRMPFGRAMFDAEPFWRSEQSWGKVPAVDVAEKDKAYEITAELRNLRCRFCASRIEVEANDVGLEVEAPDAALQNEYQLLQEALWN